VYNVIIIRKPSIEIEWSVLISSERKESNDNNKSSESKRYKRLQKLFLAHICEYIHTHYLGSGPNCFTVNSECIIYYYVRQHNGIICYIMRACTSRQSTTQCTNVDPTAIMWLEIVRNGFGPFNARCVLCWNNHARRFL